VRALDHDFDPDTDLTHAHDIVNDHVVDFDLSGEGFTDRKIITAPVGDQSMAHPPHSTAPFDVGATRTTSTPIRISNPPSTAGTPHYSTTATTTAHLKRCLTDFF
jgi:hypothetical protein